VAGSTPAHPFGNGADRKVRTMAKVVKEKLVSDDQKVELSIKFNHNWQEYIVRWKENGSFDQDKTYHTDDRDDAIGTMKAMMGQYNRTHAISKDQAVLTKLVEFWNWATSDDVNPDTREEKAEWAELTALVDKLSNRYEAHVLGKDPAKKDMKSVTWKPNDLEEVERAQIEILKLEREGYKIVSTDVGFLSTQLIYEKS
jgi:hypothetical protein